MKIVAKRNLKHILATYPLLLRMICYVFMLSTVMTLSLTLLNLYIAYEHDVELLRQHLDGIQRSQSAVLAENVWNFNEESIAMQLQGMLQHPDVVYVELIDIDKNRYTVGGTTIPDNLLLNKQFSLHFNFNDDVVELAQVKIVATVAYIKHKLLEKLPMILAVEFIKVVTVCIFIVLLFYYLFNRHLMRILAYTQSIDFNILDQKLVLDKKSFTTVKHDELDRLAIAINDMRQRLWDGNILRQEQASSLRLSAKVFESTSDGIIITDANGIIVAVNKAFTNITGYSADDIVGKNPNVLQSGRQNSQYYQQMWQQLAQSGQWSGEIWNKRKDQKIYPELLTISAIKNDDGSTTNYVAIFTDITSIKQAMEQLEYQAHHNSLTGLPNRLLLQARLEHSIQQAKRSNVHGSVLFIDLDNFKKINDSLGHDMGDLVLKDVAQRLLGVCREVDTVAHFGGDEFVVVLHDIQSIDAVAKKAQQILAELAMPFIIDGYEMYISGSIGIADFNGECQGLEVLLKEADAAMYEAKAKGKGCYHYYTAELTDVALERISLEAELRHAIELKELELYYQPQVSLHDKRIVSCEALVRWNHPQRGLLLPDEFIPISEETGLILPLGEYVLRSACSQYVRWCEMGIQLERIAVNVSGKQIHQQGFPDLVAKILMETGCPAYSLEMEITEGFIMEHPQQSISVLQQIRDLGVALSVDDFGTGHSSLSYLQKLPVQRLKIDKSFIWDIYENPEGEAITQAVIALGHSVNLTITAEGVETEAQNKFLLEHSCNEGQGYLYSRPVPLEQITALLQRS